VWSPWYAAGQYMLSGESLGSYSRGIAGCLLREYRGEVAPRSVLAQGARLCSNAEANPSRQSLGRYGSQVMPGADVSTTSGRPAPSGAGR
jgi:hypothetical protein